MTMCRTREENASDLAFEENEVSPFSEKFDSYVCIGDSIQAEHDGFVFVATIASDESHIDDDDSHNTDQTVTGCNDEQQEKLLAARDAWFRDEWFYGGVVISVFKNDIELTSHAASLWGVDINYPGSDNSYLSEVVNELFYDALHEAKSIIDKLCN